MASLYKLFSQIHSNDQCNNTEELFCFDDKYFIRKYEQTDIDFVNAYFSRGFNVSLLNEDMRGLFELSFNAFDIVLHTWLSELPVEKEIIAYGKKVIHAADSCADKNEKHNTAEKAALNRLDADALTVINASSKVQREVHRMMGLLRFSPDENGGFSAKCEPDHFILPCLGEYFTSRFGEIAWSIYDVKRNLFLRRCHGEKAGIYLSPAVTEESVKTDADEWEDLWKHYHKTINNQDRDNPGLQRQFMPQRYWKYLPEK